MLSICVRQQKPKERDILNYQINMIRIYFD